MQSGSQNTGKKFGLQIFDEMSIQDLFEELQKQRDNPSAPLSESDKGIEQDDIIFDDDQYEER